jgi:hypothetical protein
LLKAASLYRADQVTGIERNDPYSAAQKANKFRNVTEIRAGRMLRLSPAQPGIRRQRSDPSDRNGRLLMAPVGASRQTQYLVRSL